MPKPRSSSGHHSHAALAARRANLLKARAAPKERIYRRTEKRLAASRRNLRKAQAARRTARGSARPRMNALKHGLFAQRLGAAAVAALGENPRHYRELHRLFHRAFAPRARTERQLVARLADTCWRRLRLLRAQAYREYEELRDMLLSMPAAPGALDAMETERRAALLSAATLQVIDMSSEALKLQSQIECVFRTLLRKRSSGTVEFRMMSPRRDSRVAEVESLAPGKRPIGELPDRELDKRLRYLRPEQLIAQARRQREKKDSQLCRQLSS